MRTGARAEKGVGMKGQSADLLAFIIGVVATLSLWLFILSQLPDALS